MMQLRISRASVEGFQTYKVMSTMRALSDAFEASAPNSTPAQGIKAGSACEVLVGGTKLITGSIDRVHYSSKSRIWTWSGRDKTGVLTDSCPVVSTGQFVSVTAKELIAALALPFDITVSGEDGKTFTQYNVELDLPISDTIAEICSLAGLLATSTEDGNIALITAEATVSDIVLQEAHNVVDFEMTADASKVFNSYKVLGQQTFNGNTQEAATQVIGTTVGSGTSPKLKTIISPNSVDYAAAQVQSDWAAAEIESSKEALVMSIAEYTDVSPNTLITVSSPTLGIEARRLIESVLYEYSPTGGHLTTFVLVNPAKYGGTAEDYTEWL
jgi:prophage tail gpP-like protein